MASVFLFEFDEEVSSYQDPERGSWDLTLADGISGRISVHTVCDPSKAGIMSPRCK